MMYMKNNRNNKYFLNITNKQIKKHRLAQKISLEKLSIKLMLLGIDLSAQTLYNIESNKRTVTDFELCAISKCLNINPLELLIDFEKYLEIYIQHDEI